VADARPPGPRQHPGGARRRLYDRLCRSPLAELSGGKRQRAWIALALAQDTDILLLDVPTTFLDLRFQLEILELIERLNRTRGATIVIVLHDLNQAAGHAHRVIVMSRGRIVADGDPVDVVSCRLLAEVFGVVATVVTDPECGRPTCIPQRTRDRSTADR
jgi:iron complex transport system ATP-binding protein